MVCLLPQRIQGAERGIACQQGWAFAADGKKQSSSEGKLGDKLLKKVQLKAGEAVEVGMLSVTKTN